MADITEDLLQTLAAGDSIAMLLVATTGKPVGRELRAIAAELLEARAQLREVAASGVEAECRQYVTVQISPETWAKLQEVARG